MLERISLRLTPLANRTADYAPIAPACCNVCRTCTTQNVVGIALGGVAAIGAGVARLARRRGKTP